MIGSAFTTLTNPHGCTTAIGLVIAENADTDKRIVVDGSVSQQTFLRRL